MKSFHLLPAWLSEKAISFLCNNENGKFRKICCKKAIHLLKSISSNCMKRVAIFKIYSTFSEKKKTKQNRITLIRNLKSPHCVFSLDFLCVLSNLWRSLLNSFISGFIKTECQSGKPKINESLQTFYNFLTNSLLDTYIRFARWRVSWLEASTDDLQQTDNGILMPWKVLKVLDTMFLKRK